MSDDVDEVKRQRNLRKIQGQCGEAELRDVLDTYSGRAVLSTIIKECGIFSPIRSTESLQTFRELGKRDVGFWLRAKILTIDPDSAILMESESRKRDLDLYT